VPRSEAQRTRNSADRNDQNRDDRSDPGSSEAEQTCKEWSDPWSAGTASSDPAPIAVLRNARRHPGPDAHPIPYAHAAARTDRGHSPQARSNAARNRGSSSPRSAARNLRNAESHPASNSRRYAAGRHCAQPRHADNSHPYAAPNPGCTRCHSVAARSPGNWPDGNYCRDIHCQECAARTPRRGPIHCHSAAGRFPGNQSAANCCRANSRCPQSADRRRSAEPRPANNRCHSSGDRFPGNRPDCGGRQCFSGHPGFAERRCHPVHRRYGDRSTKPSGLPIPCGRGAGPNDPGRRRYAEPNRENNQHLPRYGEPRHAKVRRRHKGFGTTSAESKYRPANSRRPNCRPANSHPDEGRSYRGAHPRRAVPTAAVHRPDGERHPDEEHHR
jgi:hypothetical protein